MEKDMYLPVFIDKSIGGDIMQTVRFYYFVISVKEKGPQVANVDEMRSLSFPAIWLDSVHRFILSGPMEDDRFISVEQIVELFDLLDENDLVIDAEFYTFSNFVNDSHLNFKRGEVYRLSLDKLLALINNEAEVPFISHNSMHFSEAETLAFAEWNRQVISSIIMRYKMQPERTLRLRAQEPEK